MAKEESLSGTSMRAREAVEWLIQFAKTDLSTIGRGRRGDLLNLVDDLRRYLSTEGEDQYEPILRQAETKPLLLQEAVMVAKKLVDAAADKKKLDDLPYPAGIARFDPSAEEPVSYDDRTIHDAILKAALDDLDNKNMIARIRRCSECGKVFYAGRKQQMYCGRDCANTVASRQYYERKKSAQVANRKTRSETGAKGAKIHGKK